MEYLDPFLEIHTIRRDSELRGRNTLATRISNLATDKVGLSEKSADSHNKLPTVTLLAFNGFL
jgi:hypothetical protein